MKAPAFQLYTGDFLSSPDVQMMDAGEVGAYCLLLFNAWQTDQPGHLPNNEDKLRRLARLSAEQWQVSREMLLSKFPEAEDGLTRYNPRLVAEAEKQWVFRNKQKGNGSKGGRPRNNPNESQINPGLSENNPGLLNQNPTGNPKKALHLQSSTSSSLKETPPTPGVGVGSKKNEAEVVVEVVAEDQPAENPAASAPHTGGAADVATSIEPRPEFRPDPEWAPQMRLLAGQLADFFKLGQQQADARMQLTRFAKTLFENGKGELLATQFTAYRAYKAAADERVHSWKSYLGHEGRDYADGAWNEKDWPALLAATLKNSPHASAQHRFGSGPAASAGRATTLDRESYAGRRPTTPAQAA